MLKKKLRFTPSATKALVAFDFTDKISVNFLEAEVLEVEAIGAEAETVCKYTASTSLLATQFRRNVSAVASRW